MTTLQPGETYTRGEIHAAVGGGVQDYLPHVSGEVVCACLSADLNPDAPEVVLPGTSLGIERWARVFAEQSHHVPTFLKRGTNAWEYVGDYRVRRLAVQPAEIARHAEAAHRDDVTMVLYLERAV